MSNNNVPFTPQNLYFTLGEFILSWLNIISYHRKLYPPESFNANELTSFGIIVPMSRHPNVIKWQKDLVAEILELLVDVQQKTSINRFSDKILDSQDDDDDIEISNKNDRSITINRIKSVSLIIFKNLFPKKNTKGFNPSIDPIPIEKFTIDLSQIHIPSNDDLTKQIDATNTLNWSMVYEEFRSAVMDLLAKLRIANDSDPADLGPQKPENDPFDQFSGSFGSSLESSAKGGIKAHSLPATENINQISSSAITTDSQKNRTVLDNYDIELSYDVYLETHKDLSITNYSQDWMLDTKQQLVNKSDQTHRNPAVANDSQGMKVQFRSIKGVEVGPLEFHQWYEKVV
ncbi:hypothetical protein DASC09_026610 [Saccharomycopsis crataegensis]|uniref:DNA-binding protein n=1 Tax=Saccharomycopsis crataegensis TaxID=43959 RepID=A0AAV5QKX2_9ASCO|nr:hypothetical protein DASC09_026610 [Saccharomycopsis crataegensis]